MNDGAMASATSDVMAKALVKTGVAVREAAADDEVAGVRPRWVALPETTEDVAALLGVCAEHDLAVVPVGGGTKLHWGRRPDRCDVLLDLCCLNEILEHAAGDLVVRVQAGVTMAALAEALAAHGQELALDVPLDGATVGGTLATATAGPRSLRYGTARDLLIGITVVLADGTTAKSGGKVVKNVAGYDLGKLFTGSYGTLGVITEATFRLHPVPPDRRWVSASYPGPRLETKETGSSLYVPDPPERILVALAASQAEPSAIEIDWPAVDGPYRVSALLEGHAAAHRALAVQDLFGEHAPTAQTPLGEQATAGAAHERPDDHEIALDEPEGWGRLPGDEVLVEVRAPVERGQSVMVEVFDAARTTGLPAASRMWLGDHLVVLIGLPDDADPSAAAGFVALLRGGLEDDCRVRVVTAPPEAARRMDRWGHVGALTLMRRVKERFDPGRRMSPGRYVGGI